MKNNMRILCLSEHFLPRVAGTVAYVVETCRGLARQGHDVTLLAPGPAAPADCREPYRVIRIDVGATEHGDLPRKLRYAFCRRAAEAVETALSRREADVVHVLFGLFLMETLVTKTARAVGVPILATVHNVPPMECRRSFESDAFHRRAVDTLRLHAMTAKNATRLRAHHYDTYVVPSDQVHDALVRRLPEARVIVIGHGVGSDVPANEPTRVLPPTGRPARLLTVGGFVPHKRQHLIPAICKNLISAGVAVSWDVVGPTGRVAKYFNHICADASARGLGGTLRLFPAVSDTTLAEFYARADLYIQPSTEEGFCMTALDAAAWGLPVIGCPAGALPQIAEASGGCIVHSNVEALSTIIARFVREGMWPTDRGARRVAIHHRWSWKAQVAQLVDTYTSLASIAVGRTPPRFQASCEGS